MSFPIQYECPSCFGLTGMAGRMMGAKHRCTCPDTDEEQVPIVDVERGVAPDNGNTRIAA